MPYDDRFYDPYYAEGEGSESPAGGIDRLLGKLQGHGCRESRFARVLDVRDEVRHVLTLRLTQMLMKSRPVLMLPIPKLRAYRSSQLKPLKRIKTIQYDLLH